MLPHPFLRRPRASSDTGEDALPERPLVKSLVTAARQAAREPHYLCQSIREGHDETQG
jgi:hypothetical protein